MTALMIVGGVHGDARRNGAQRASPGYGLSRSGRPLQYIRLRGAESHGRARGGACRRHAYPQVPQRSARARDLALGRVDAYGLQAADTASPLAPHA